MAITDCRFWGVTEAEYDGVQLAGSYAVRFQVQADQVYGARELINLCQIFPKGGAADPASQPVPKKWSTYDFRTPLSSDLERDPASFAKRHEARLRDVESGFYNWWVDVIFERLEPGEIPPLDDQGDLIEDPTKWPYVYTLQTFTVGNVIDRGIPRDAAVRGKTLGTIPPDPSSGDSRTFVPNFADLPESQDVTSDPFIPITNQAGTPPSVYQRENLARPLLICRAYVQSLCVFYKDITRAKGTANKDLFFGQAPGYACFKDGRIVGGRRYEFSADGETFYNFYEVEYRWELWGNVKDAICSANPPIPGVAPTSKERPCAEVQVINEGFFAWSDAAPAGTLQPIAETNSQGDPTLVTDPWPLEEDGTAKAAADADTYDTYGWWFKLPYDYTLMADGAVPGRGIASSWPQYDFESVKPRRN